MAGRTRRSRNSHLTGVQEASHVLDTEPGAIGPQRSSHPAGRQARAPNAKWNDATEHGASIVTPILQMKKLKHMGINNSSNDTESRARGYRLYPEAGGALNTGEALLTQCGRVRKVPGGSEVWAEPQIPKGPILQPQAPFPVSPALTQGAQAELTVSSTMALSWIFLMRDNPWG